MIQRFRRFTFVVLLGIIVFGLNLFELLTAFADLFRTLFELFSRGLRLSMGLTVKGDVLTHRFCVRFFYNFTLINCSLATRHGSLKCFDWIDTWKFFAMTIPHLAISVFIG